ncbi:uncharacterized protein LOC134535253 [Bacillus rossius redtenbacheri]|uniref:uncharacterized protein LOC134535253 n=1 Tax=Bacillus rossius redtenbacheri TaxID=93214 RepID=UPI002FDE722E
MGEGEGGRAVAEGHEKKSAVRVDAARPSAKQRSVSRSPRARDNDTAPFSLRRRDGGVGGPAARRLGDFGARSVGSRKRADALKVARVKDRAREWWLGNCGLFRSSSSSISSRKIYGRGEDKQKPRRSSKVVQGRPQPPAPRVAASSLVESGGSQGKVALSGVEPLAGELFATPADTSATPAGVHEACAGRSSASRVRPKTHRNKLAAAEWISGCEREERAVCGGLRGTHSRVTMDASGRCFLQYSGADDS